MATAGLVKELAAVEAPPPGIAASPIVAEESSWHLLFSPVLLDDAVMPITRHEHEAAEQALAAIGTTARNAEAENDIDHEFEAILQMKAEPLVLTESEAEVYTRVRQSRARQVAKPLPLE
jgi:hypothetical protein